MARKPKSNQYIGVSWKAASKKYEAFIKINGHTKYLGLFKHPEQAAIAFDDALYEQWQLGRPDCKFNFGNPEDPLTAIERKYALDLIELGQIFDYSEPGASAATSAPANKSHFTGVYYYKPRKRWRASIIINKQSHFIGSSATEFGAAQLYAKKLQTLYAENQDSTILQKRMREYAGVIASLNAPTTASTSIIKDCESPPQDSRTVFEDIPDLMSYPWPEAEEETDFMHTEEDNKLPLIFSRDSTDSLSNWLQCIDNEHILEQHGSSSSSSIKTSSSKNAIL